MEVRMPYVLARAEIRAGDFLRLRSQRWSCRTGRLVGGNAAQYAIRIPPQELSLSTAYVIRIRNTQYAATVTASMAQIRNAQYAIRNAELRPPNLGRKYALRNTEYTIQSSGHQTMVTNTQYAIRNTQCPSICPQTCQFSSVHTSFPCVLQYVIRDTDTECRELTKTGVRKYRNRAQNTQSLNT